MNKIKDTLITLGIATEESIELYFEEKIRDQDKINGKICVLRCSKSGVIFLSRTDHLTDDYYAIKVFNGRGAKNREEAVKSTIEDSQRRYEMFKDVITNKKWLDIGTGSGGVLDLLSKVAAETIAVEPQEKARQSLVELKYSVYPSLKEVPGDFDIVTLFHVFEHMNDPISELISIRSKMKKGGKIIIEVPHAKDLLISFLENEDFKAFTFWVEHLILHTRESLETFLKAGGFSNINVTGFQRYPLANHLYWLSKGKPGGHQSWSFLRNDNLDAAYTDMLARINKTDTLIATAENPE